MKPAVDQQPEMDFGASLPRDGLEQWREQRRAMTKRLGQELGLPLDREVEVWLTGGVRLRGRLRLREEMLFIETPRELNIELVVDGVAFKWTEIESCVRTD